MRLGLILSSLLFSQLLFAEGSILGRWKTIDDKTKQPKGIVEITEKDGVFTGRLVETFDKSKTICTECPGEKKGQPFVGLELVWDVKKTGDNEWREGRIMDPNNGKTYRVRLALEDKDQKLMVRGYLGFDTPLTGRTQHWLREPAAVAAPVQAPATH